MHFVPIFHNPIQYESSRLTSLKNNALITFSNIEVTFSNDVIAINHGTSRCVTMCYVGQYTVTVGHAMVLWQRSGSEIL